MDRLGWAAGLAFEVEGLRIGLRASDSATLDDLLPLLPQGWQPLEEGEVDALYSVVRGGRGPGHRRRFHLLYADEDRIARTHEWTHIARQLEAVLQIYVATWATERVFVHAGVVGWQGRAILLPGHTRCGKSTLVQALLERGARYLSDDFAVLDHDGRVEAYPVDLRLRDPAREGSTRPRPRPAPTPEQPLPIGAIILTRYEPGASWLPTSPSAGRAALALLEHSAASRYDPDRVVNLAIRIAKGVRLTEGPRGEADETAGRILSWLTHDLE